MGEAISPAQLLRICEYRRKKPTQFHDFSQILASARIAEKTDIAEIAFEVFITAYFECVINYVILQDKISQVSFFFNFYLIAFGGVHNSSHFRILIHSNLL